MAAALANDMGGTPVDAASGGTKPDGRLLPGTITALREVGIDTTALIPTPISRVQLEQADIVVAIGVDVERESLLDGISVEAWDIENPGGQLASFRQARDEIGLRVRKLLREHGASPDVEEGEWEFL